MSVSEGRPGEGGAVASGVPSRALAYAPSWDRKDDVSGEGRSPDRTSRDGWEGSGPTTHKPSIVKGLRPLHTQTYVRNTTEAALQAQ